MDCTSDKPSVRRSEKEIDLLELVKKFWARRRFILKCAGAGALAGLVVAFSIPAEYAVGVKMVAEETDNAPKLSSGVSSLMSLVGVGQVSASGYGIGVMMYPEVAATIPFLADMSTVQVQPRRGAPMSLYEYIDGHQRTAWWNGVLTAPSRLMGWAVSLFASRGENDAAAAGVFDVSRLTRSQYDYIRTMRQRVGIDLDKKTGIISARVVMQDPAVAAAVADSLVAKLQQYIARYRTDKAREDLRYCQQAFDEAKKQYYEAQNRYAVFVDQNKDLIRQSVKTEQYRLNNEMDLAYNVYSAVAQQLETAKLKVQEQTPCLTVIEPASEPLQKSSPGKAKILAVFVFLGILAGCVYLAGVEVYRSFQKSSSMPR